MMSNLQRTLVWLHTGQDPELCQFLLQSLLHVVKKWTLLSLRHLLLLVLE